MSISFIASAKQVIDTEIAGIVTLHDSLGENFVAACQKLLHCRGKVVVSGMGKSGHIGNKIAATLASTGTPAFFMHPGEANHGDLGMLSPDDIVIGISNSGETDELLGLLPVLKRLGIALIAITQNTESTLARHADIVLAITVPAEACSLGLAPTTSTTVTLVLGDALAIALLDAKGFTSEDFALSHPGGSLGRKLLLTCRCYFWGSAVSLGSTVDHLPGRCCCLGWFLGLLRFGLWCRNHGKRVQLWRSIHAGYRHRTAG